MVRTMREFIKGVDVWIDWHERHMTDKQKMDTVTVGILFPLELVIIAGILLGW